MASVPYDPAILTDLERFRDARAAATLSDRQLLEQFLTRGGALAEAAFAALVERHGPMVMGTCQGVLRDSHDAQDAFQATFLVLSRRAGSIRRKDSAGSWLYGVARRVSMRTKADAARRRAIERRSVLMISRCVESTTPPEPCPELFEELDRLPERFREPIVLIDLEGCTQEEAAERMRCPLGTVQSRLARGRGRLRARLVRRGLAPSAGVFIATVWHPGAFAIPAALADSTVRAATAFVAGSAAAGSIAPSVVAVAKGVLKTMIMFKWQMGAAAVGACVLCAGAAVNVAAVIHASDGPPTPGVNAQTRSAVAKHVAALHGLLRQAHKRLEKTQGAAPPAVATVDDKDQDKADTDAQKLKGNWKVVSLAVDGANQAEVPDHALTFEDGKFQLRIDGQERAKGIYHIDSAAKPKTLDLAFIEGLHAGETMPGIFAWDGDRLKLCVNAPKGDRPKDFNSAAGSGHRNMVFKKD